jgi:hypothetical protein
MLDRFQHDCRLDAVPVSVGGGTVAIGNEALLAGARRGL